MSGIKANGAKKIGIESPHSSKYRLLLRKTTNVNLSSEGDYTALSIPEEQLLSSFKTRLDTLVQNGYFSGQVDPKILSSIRKQLKVFNNMPTSFQEDFLQGLGSSLAHTLVEQQQKN